MTDKVHTKIKNIINKIPHRPGVYQFKDTEDCILYIGKAKDLNKRVKSYFQKSAKHSIRIQKLISQVVDIDCTVVTSELEALILESNMIKEVRPKYNVMMKDDKNYVYIKVTKKEDFPRIMVVRQVLNDGAVYFGPKTAAGKVNKVLNAIQKLFPYRNCNLGIDYIGDKKVNITKKTIKYPCLEFHIKRCIAPCIGNCSKAEYANIIDNILNFLKGNSSAIIESISKEMQKAALDKKFEKAAQLRDKLQIIDEMQAKQLVSAPTGEDLDVINFAKDLGRIFITLFMIRDGKLINQENFIFKYGVDDEQFEDNTEVIEAFIKQYYEKTTDFPKEIIIPDDLSNKSLIESWLKAITKKNIHLNIPQKGKKKKLLVLTQKNAENYAVHSKLKWQNDDNRRKKALEELMNKLKLKKLPRRIESYDISHTSGTNQVASMVVFENGTPINKKYRRFKIRTVPDGKPDDFAAMLEVLKRRFLYLQKSISKLKVKKCIKKDVDTIRKLTKLKKIDNKDYFKIVDKDKIIGLCKHINDDNYDYFYGIKYGKLDAKLKEDFITCMIEKAVKNRVYVSVKKTERELLEKIGFQKLKKKPENLKVKRGEECLLFNKSKYKEEKGFAQKPDLILIDGGKGQLAQGIKVQKDSGVEIPMISLAKKFEDVYAPGNKSPLNIAKDSDGLYLLQQIRDEAHRFAITFHKKLRSKRALS